MVMPGDNIEFEAELITPIAMEKGVRFAIREGGTRGRGRHQRGHCVTWRLNSSKHLKWPHPKFAFACDRTITGCWMTRW